MGSTLSTTSQTSILHDLQQTGWAYIQPNYYMHPHNDEEKHDLDQVQSTYDYLSKDPSPGNRYRAYIKLNWSAVDQTYVKNTTHDYFQSKKYNSMDGGKIRKFDPIDNSFLDSSLIRSLLKKDIEIAKQTKMFIFDAHLEIGLHQVRYQPTSNETSYSSPKWLHKDDEPLVFLHLLNITENLTGGDNLFASDRKTITKTLRLKMPLETLLFDQKVYHAVTPMNCSDGDSAYRDILLVTFQRKQPQDNGDVELIQ